MKRTVIFPQIFIIFSLIFSSSVAAKIEPPNYDFKLDDLMAFMPDKTLDVINEKFGAGTLMEKNKESSIRKFHLTHQRYNFPIFVQLDQNKVSDFFATLPSYFLHDVFHQSLINKLGKQDTFFNKENTSVYQWKNKEGLDYIYGSTCTITCFPLYLAVKKTEQVIKNPPLVQIFANQSGKIKLDLLNSY